MSPSEPPPPARAGSTRHSACLLPVVSVGPESQSCGYSTCDQPELAELAGADHLPHAADQRIAGVVVGEGEDASRRRDRRLHALGLDKRDGQRLVADDVDARLQQSVGRRSVDVVGRHDRRRLDAVRARRLGLGHGLEVVVDAVRRKTQRLTGTTRFLRRRRQGAGDQFVLVVDARGDAVHRADEGALAAAHHAEPDPAAPHGVAASLDRHRPALLHFNPSVRRIID